MSVLYRGAKPDQIAEYERDYIDKFSNPFSAAVRGTCLLDVSF